MTAPEITDVPVDLAAGTAAPDRRLPRSGRGRPPWLGGVLGMAVIVAAWSITGGLHAANGAVPTPWAVLRQMRIDGWHFYSVNAGVTLRGAALGFLWGNGAALAIAVVVLLVPFLETVAEQLAVISYCMPLTAIGPIVLVVFGGRAPTVFLAALAVFFTTLVGALLGLRAADPVTLDVVSAYGGGRWEQLRRVLLVAALPDVLNALKIAAPAAMLGAIIGEYLGGVDNGLGVVLTVSQQQYAVARTWGLMLVTGLLAGAGYGLFSLVSARVTPWATGDSRGGQS